MATTDTRLPLKATLKVTKEWEQEVAQMLKHAADDAAAHFNRVKDSKSVGDQIRAIQLKQAQQTILQEQAALWRQIGDSIQASQAEAAASAIAVGFQFDEELLKQIVPAADRNTMLRSMQAEARSGVEAAKARVEGASYKPLSERVYDSAAMSTGQLNRTINSGLARGLSAHEMANEVKGFINPATPGGTSYAAMRLGRTEINNAAHATSIQKYQTTPWVDKVEWHLSGSHPKPDECNDYADEQYFDPNQVPGKPHPNCLCYLTPETVSNEDFIKGFFNGSYDNYIDDAMREHGYAEELISSSKLPPTPAPASRRVADLPDKPLYQMQDKNDWGMQAFMTYEDPQVRAANTWAQTYQGQDAVRAVLRNVRSGQDTFAGPEFDTFYEKWGVRVQREVNGVLSKPYTKEAAEAELINSAKYIEASLSEATKSSSSLYRGMRMDKVFEEGQTFEVDFSSATPHRKTAGFYLEENEYRTGKHKVMMILDEVDSVNIDNGLMKHGVEGSDEHLVTGTLRVQSVVQDGDVWEVHVVQAK